MTLADDGSLTLDAVVAGLGSASFTEVGASGAFSATGSVAAGEFAAVSPLSLAGADFTGPTAITSGASTASSAASGIFTSSAVPAAAFAPAVPPASPPAAAVASDPVAASCPASTSSTAALVPAAEPVLAFTWDESSISASSVVPAAGSAAAASPACLAPAGGLPSSHSSASTRCRMCLVSLPSVWGALEDVGWSGVSGAEVEVAVGLGGGVPAAGSTSPLSSASTDSASESAVCSLDKPEVVASG